MFSHSVHLSDEEAHVKSTRQDVRLLCLHSICPVLGCSFPTKMNRSKKGQVGVILRTHLLLVFFL